MQLEFTFKRFARTAYSEGYYIHNDEGFVGELNIHSNKCIHGNLIVTQELSEETLGELITQIEEDIVSCFGDREDFIFTAYKGEEIGFYSDIVTDNERPVHKNDLDRLYEKLETLSTNMVNHNRSLIITEGKTDWKHIKAALSKLQLQEKDFHLDIDFLEYEEDVKMGDSELISMCKQYSKTKHLNKIIFIFDRDTPKIINEVNNSEEDFKDWGNNVFSFSIPVPEHRKETPDVCIELYYKDEDLKKTDENGRRIYLSNEFNSMTGRHINLDVICADKNKYSSKMLTIIDNNIFDNCNNNVALSKNAYANNIMQNKYDNIDVSEFKKIFDVLREIEKV